MGFNPFAAGGGAGGDYVHNYTTFDDLGIDTHGKTMEEILKEVADMNLPVNTIITGQLYTEAAPDERIYNCEGEIQITQGKYGQVYWCRATSASISPYSWDSIYNQTTDEDNPIDNILPWTPTYYQSTEINEIKKKLEELGADWVGRFERDEDGNILGEYFNDYENNKATGLYSHTEGSMNVNLGETGHVEGYNNQLNSTEKGSHVEGWENIVKGECNHTEGRGNKIYRDNIHVDGISNSTDDITDEKIERNSLGSHITGVSNKIHGKVQASSVEGVENTISGDQSFSSIGIHVEGTINTVEGSASYSHIEGINNKLDGFATNTHVEGQQNIVRNSVSSHTGGIQNYVEGAAAGYTTGSFNCNKSKEGFVSGYMNSAENKQVAVFGCGNFNNGSNSVIFGGAQDGTSAVYATKTKITSVANGVKSHLRQNKGRNFSFQYSGATLTLEAEITGLSMGSAICIQQFSRSEVIAEFITYVLEKDGKNITVASMISSSEDGLYITKYTSPFGNMNSSGNSLVVGTSNRTFNQNQIKNDLIIGLNNDFSGRNTLVQGNSNVIDDATDSFISGNYNWTATPFRSQIFGDSNAVNDFYCSYLQGEQNTVVRTQFSHIEGVNNGIYPNTNGTFINTSGDYVYNVHVEGLNNRIYGNAKGAHVEGTNNVVYEGTQRNQHPHIAGYQNIVKNATYVQGCFNNVHAENSYTLGWQNTVANAADSVVIGGSSEGRDTGGWMELGGGSVYPVAYVKTITRIDLSSSDMLYYEIELQNDSKALPFITTEGTFITSFFKDPSNGFSFRDIDNFYNYCAFITLISEEEKKYKITPMTKRFSIDTIKEGIKYYFKGGNFSGGTFSTIIGTDNVNTQKGSSIIGHNNRLYWSNDTSYRNDSDLNYVFGAGNVCYDENLDIGNMIIGRENLFTAKSVNNHVFGNNNYFVENWSESNYIIGSDTKITIGSNNISMGTLDQSQAGGGTIEKKELFSGKIIKSYSTALTTEESKKGVSFIIETDAISLPRDWSRFSISLTTTRKSDGTKIRWDYVPCSLKDSTHIYVYQVYGLGENISRVDIVGEEITGTILGNCFEYASNSVPTDNIVIGQQNYIFGTSKNKIFGSNNIIRVGASENTIFGKDNLVYWGCNNAFVGGYNNIAAYGEHNFIFGHDNEVENSSSYNAILGFNSHLQSASNNFIASGAENTQLGKQSSQSINANTILSGANSKIGMRYDGTGATYRGSNTIINGGEHQIDGSFNVCGVGSSDIVSCRNVDFGQDSVIKNKGDNAILCGNANKILSGKYIADDNYDPDDANRAGQYNVVAGQGNTVYASNAYVFGLQNIIGEEPTEDKTTPNANSDRYSLTMGQGNTSLGQCCVVSGFSNNIKKKEFSLVMGAINTVEQNCCLVCGTANTITSDRGGYDGVLVVGTGNNTITNNACALLLGSGNSDITNNSCVLLLGNGGNNITHSQYTYVSGGSNTANKVHYSIISGGANSVYSADYSYILGMSNSLGAEDSNLVSNHVFLFGNNLKSSGEQNKIISGTFNAIDTEDKFALVIGNGTADDARSNAFAVSKTGDIYVKNSDTPIDLAPVPMSLLEEICV